MYNECFSHMSKMFQKDISFSHKVQNSAGKNEFVYLFTASFLGQI